jgi:CubicO group peptidase (beta-lactamase class C family)
MSRTAFLAGRVFAALACSLTLAAILSTSPVSAQVAQDDRVSEAVEVVRVWLDAQHDYERIPSIAASIVHDQELVWSGAVGMAHPDAGAAATPTTLYSICSISKLFTSVALMQLRDRGLVDLHDPVSKHLPWFTLQQQYEGSAPITVEGILTHSAGLPRESDQPYWSAPDFPFPTREEIIAGLKNQETLYPAWKYFQYSNLGLTLAGEIVRERSGMAYDAYVRANVLEPLGLTNTYPEIPEQHRGGQLATGYGALNRQGIREEQPFFQARGIAPAAGYASTVEDLAKFASWQFRLTGDRNEVLDAHTLAEMHRVHYVDPGWNTYWGLGFSVTRGDEETFVGHGGSCPGFRSQLLLQEDRKIATVVMANAMVNAGMYARGIYNVVKDAITEAAAGDVAATTDGAETASRGGAREVGTAASADARDTADTQETPDLTPYLGAYSEQPWGGETAAVRWKGGLALLSLPTENPVEALTRLKHVEGDVFRRIRSDEELGEEIVFERDASGSVTGFRQFGNLSPRVR